MMDFIMVPLTTGIVFAAIYGLFELFVRRKERLAIIEKIGEKLDASAFEGKMRLTSYGGTRFSFSSLKAGCLLVGIGLGVLVGFFLNIMVVGGGLSELRHFEEERLIGAAYGASVLLFGGLGLIIAFVIETNMKKKEDK